MHINDLYLKNAKWASPSLGAENQRRFRNALQFAALRDGSGVQPSEMGFVGMCLANSTAEGYPQVLVWAVSDDDWHQAKADLSKPTDAPAQLLPPPPNWTQE